ncbi:MAG: type III-B CRISPR module RAMP protein Cmr4, partial [Acidobacteriota bacterium]
MMTVPRPFLKEDYYAIALDPVHIGTGGYRIGRVDNTIVREPATRLPKIPGTSLAGVIRAYAALWLQVNDPASGKYPGCAGKGGAEGEGHCGRSDCPICMAFGFSKKQRSFQGLAQFSDGQLLLFPVHTLAGTVWMTSPERLNTADLEFQRPQGWDVDIVLVSPALANHLPQLDSGAKGLNLGWMLFDVDSSQSIPSVDLLGWSRHTAWKELMTDRIAVIHENHFSHLVNSALEIRTSVAINPRTGAQLGGALFTYEALPRGSVVTFSLVVLDPRFFRVPKRS